MQRDYTELMRRVSKATAAPTAPKPTTPSSSSNSRIRGVDSFAAASGTAPVAAHPAYSRTLRASRQALDVQPPEVGIEPIGIGIGIGEAKMAAGLGSGIGIGLATPSAPKTRSLRSRGWAALEQEAEEQDRDRGEKKERKVVTYKDYLRSSASSSQMLSRQVTDLEGELEGFGGVKAGGEGEGGGEGEREGERRFRDDEEARRQTKTYHRGRSPAPALRIPAALTAPLPSPYPKVIPFTTLEWEFGASLDAKVTGGYQWGAIHPMSRLNTGDPRKQATFVSVVLTNLSCHECFKHMGVHIQRRPFSMAQAEKSAKETKNPNLYCAEWWNTLHNQVNSGQKKPPVSFAAANSYWLSQHEKDSSRYLRNLTTFWHFCAQYQLSRETQVRKKHRKFEVANEAEEQSLQFFRMVPLARFVHFILVEDFLIPSPDVRRFIEVCTKHGLLNPELYYPANRTTAFSSESFHAALFKIEQELWGSSLVHETRILPDDTRARLYRYARAPVSYAYTF